MKRILLYIAFSAAVAANVRAQYLPNYGFEQWKGDGRCGNSYQSSTGALFGGKAPEGERQRPGNEPEGWNGSSVNQKVMTVTKQETLVELTGETPDGSQAVRLTNKYVGAGTIGSNAPAFITFATPWVYAVSNISSCDGGAYGGTAFTHRPDAIRGLFRRPDNGNGEKAHIIAYLWKGTFRSSIPATGGNLERDNVDRVVMGRAEASEAGTLVASCDYEFTSTAGDGWEEITVPLNYADGAADAPEMMNVIISSADYWTRGNIQAGSVLEADNVQFVYYSELASFTFDGTAYTPQPGGTVEVPAAYDADKVAYTRKGIGATVSSTYDADSRVLTIVVTGNDADATPANCHTYRFSFAEEGTGPVDPVEPVDPTDPETPGLGERVTDLAATSPEKTYVLYNEHFTAYAVHAAAHHGTNVWTAGMRGDDGHTLSNDTYAEPLDATLPSSSWMILPREGGYCLYNVGAGKYLAVPDGNKGNSSLFCTFTDTAVVLTLENLGEGRFAVTRSGGQYDYMCAAPQASAPLATWESSDAGAAWQIVENPNVAPDADLLATLVKPLGDKVSSLDETSYEKTYVLYNEHFTAYAVYDATQSATDVWAAGMTGDDDHPLHDEGYAAPLQPKDAGSSWMIIPYMGGYCLYNMGAGKFLSTPAYDGSTSPCTFTDVPVKHTVVELGDGNFAFTAAGHAQDYLCAAPQAASPVSIWRVTDAGSAWQLRENPNVAATPELGDVVSAVTGAPVLTPARGIYTLQGTRLSVTSTRHLPAGVYIVDGRKVVVGRR